MKKLFAALVALCLLAGLLAGCTPAPSGSNGSVPSGSQNVLTPGEAGGDGAQVVLLLTAAQKESALGQVLVNTIGRFSGEENIGSATYTVDAQDAGTTGATLELAVKGGAQLVVATGDELAARVLDCAAGYPDLEFLLFVHEAGETTPKNVSQYVFDALQAGWLVGWAAVMNGERGLACTMGETEAERQLAYGFAAGAAYAAGNLEPDEEETLRLYEVEYEPGMPAANRRALRTLEEQDAGLLLVNREDQQAVWATAAMANGYPLVYLSNEKPAEGMLRALMATPASYLYETLLRWAEDGITGGRAVHLGLSDAVFLLVPGSEEEAWQVDYEALLALFQDGSIATSLREGFAAFEAGEATEGLPSVRRIPLDENGELVIE